MNALTLRFRAPSRIFALVLTRGGWLLTALLALDFFPASSGTAPGAIRWNELAALVVGRNVLVPLVEGVVVEGEALSVRDNSLMLDIGKTSDAVHYPRALTSIPRSSVSEVRLTAYRGSGGRILGSVLGILAGLIAGAEVAIHGAHSEAAGVFTFSAVSAGCTFGAYYLGKRADRHTTRLLIAPPADDPASPSPGDAQLRQVSTNQW